MLLRDAFIRSQFILLSACHLGKAPVRAETVSAALAEALSESSQDCALSALQLRGQRTSAALHYPAVKERGDASASYAAACAKANHACASLEGKLNSEVEEVYISLGTLKEVLAVSPAGFYEFERAVSLGEILALGDRVPCQELCHRSASFLAECGIMIPPGPELGCRSSSSGPDRCDVNLSAEHIVRSYGSPDVQSMYLGAGRKMPMLRNSQTPGARVREKVKFIDPLQHDFQSDVDYHVKEIALRLLYLFHVYPRAFNTFLSSSTDPTWQDKVAELNLVARVYLVNTIRHLRLHHTRPYIETWFGKGAFTHNATRTELLRILNSVLKVMDTAELVFNSTNCDASDYAFVFPVGSRGVPDPNDPDADIRVNAKGNFVVNLCPFAIYGPVFEGVQAFVHEASHHAAAFTADVYACHRVRYLSLDTSQLLSLDGSDCRSLIEGPTKPRFSQHGLSCHVHGRTILPIVDVERSAKLFAMEQNETYELSLLRFSQDGSRGLFEVRPMALLGQDDCPMAYGQSMCKYIAQLDPARAIMNADSIGYYVIDAGSAGFAASAGLQRRI